MGKEDKDIPRSAMLSHAAPKHFLRAVAIGSVCCLGLKTRPTIPTPADVRAVAAKLKELSAKQLAANAIRDTGLDDAAVALGLFFAGAAEHDAEDIYQKEIAESFFAYYSSRRAAKAYTNATAAEQAALVPRAELTEAHTMLLARLTELASWTASAPRPLSPRANATERRAVRSGDGYWRADGGAGAPLFGIGFSRLQKFTPPTIGAEQTFLRHLNVLSVSEWADMSVLLNPDLSVNNSLLQPFRDGLDAAHVLGTKMHILLGQGAPHWAHLKWPSLSDPQIQHGVSYNIDSPGAAVLVPSVIKAILDYVGCHPALAGFVLANEPTFRRSDSNYTRTAFTAALMNKYSTIEALNAAWHSSWGSFREAAQGGTDETRPSGLVYPPVPNICVRGVWHCNGTEFVARDEAARWHDWNEFNDARVTRFFRHMHAALEIQGKKAVAGFRPGAPCVSSSIKLQNNVAFGTEIARVSSGIDRLSLAEMNEVSGCDTRILPWADHKSQANGGGPIISSLGSYDNGSYSTDWLPLAMGYTLMRSHAPHKLLLDSEWHPGSTTGFRCDPTNDCRATHHLRIATWLALLFGQSESTTWYWARDISTGALERYKPGSKESSWFPESGMMHPQMLEDYAHTMLIANVAPVPQKIASVTLERPQVWLLRSRVTTYMDIGASQVFNTVFETLSFVGCKIGIVEEERLEANVTNSDLLVIPATSFVSNKTVAFARSGKASLLVVEDPTEHRTMRFSHNGQYVRSDHELAFLKNATNLKLSDAGTMLPAVAAVVASVGASPRVHCLDAASKGDTPALGVLCRSTIDTVFVLNLRNSSAQVRLDLKAENVTKGEWMDLTTRKMLDTDPTAPAGIELPIRTVRVLGFRY